MSRSFKAIEKFVKELAELSEHYRYLLKYCVHTEQEKEVLDYLYNRRVEKLLDQFDSEYYLN